MGVTQVQEDSAHSSNVTMATMRSRDELLLEVLDPQSIFSDGAVQVRMLTVQSSILRLVGVLATSCWAAVSQHSTAQTIYSHIPRGCQLVMTGVSCCRGASRHGCYWSMQTEAAWSRPSKHGVSTAEQRPCSTW